MITTIHKGNFMAASQKIIFFLTNQKKLTIFIPIARVDHQYLIFIFRALFIIIFHHPLILYYYNIKTHNHTNGLMKQSSNKALISSTRPTQAQKDQQAYQNTRKVAHEQQELRKQYRRWVPQSISSENAIFTQVAPKNKPMKKQNRTATLSINIFEIGGNFKPCVKRNELSVRNSNLFTEQQSSSNWRSSSKRVEVRESQEWTPKNIFKAAATHAGKKSSIDLSWASGPTQPQQSRSIRSSQGRSIYNNLYGSSIRL